MAQPWGLSKPQELLAARAEPSAIPSFHSHYGKATGSLRGLLRVFVILDERLGTGTLDRTQRACLHILHVLLQHVYYIWADVEEAIRREATAVQTIVGTTAQVLTLLASCHPFVVGRTISTFYIDEAEAFRVWLLPPAGHMLRDF